MTTMRQNSDGSWSPAELIPWRGGAYWEMFSDSAALVGPDSDITTVRSRRPSVLKLKMIAVSLWHWRRIRR